MQKSPLIGVCIIAVVLLIVASLSNVVGYQAVQTSNQYTIKEEINQKECLFQTIIDMANNKEIQRIVSTSEMRSDVFFDAGMMSSIGMPHVLTKKNLNRIYLIGVVLSKILSISKMQKLLKQYQENTQGLQNEITKVIEKDPLLKAEMMQLSNQKCDCENGIITPLWTFPVICTILIPFIIFSLMIYFSTGVSFFGDIIVAIASTLNCYWLHL
jgi:hypothetical protein